MCALLSSLHDLCVLSDKRPKLCVLSGRRPKTGMLGENDHRRSLRLDDGSDGPWPLDWTKAFIDRRRENGLWSVPARDTNRPHGADVGFLSNMVVSSAQRRNDNWPIALIARKSRQMKIMRCGFQRADECSIPGHWRHRPVVYNGLLAQLGDVGHRALLLLCYSSFEPTWLGAGRAVTPAPLL